MWVNKQQTLATEWLLGWLPGWKSMPGCTDWKPDCPRPESSSAAGGSQPRQTSFRPVGYREGRKSNEQD